MAVNYTGAGGVPAGTVYAAIKVGGFEPGSSMFVPEKGGLKFSQRWAVTFEEGPYERCGPAWGKKKGKPNTRARRGWKLWRRRSTSTSTRRPATSMR